MNLNEFSEYRQTIMRQLGDNQRIKDYLTNTSNSTATLGELIHTYIFPYQYVPGTTSSKKAYITMDIAVPTVTNRTFKTVSMTVFVFCDDSICGCENPDTGKQCLRYDLLAREIDKILNGNKDLGFQAELSSVRPYFPYDNHHGLVLQYKTVEFNR